MIGFSAEGRWGERFAFLGTNCAPSAPPIPLRGCASRCVRNYEDPVLIRETSTSSSLALCCPFVGLYPLLAVIIDLKARSF